MSTRKRLQRLVEQGLYYLTEHAYAEAIEEELDVYDVEHALLTGRIRRQWTRERKMEWVGEALDGRTIGVVCRVTRGGKVRVITVYEDRAATEQ